MTMIEPTLDWLLPLSIEKPLITSDVVIPGVSLIRASAFAVTACVRSSERCVRELAGDNEITFGPAAEQSPRE